ncbi:MAG: 16S rRNA (cytosine(967)-C(5))-methyltransferase RsmB [Clostridia bacterium]|nr:16S rRNA (cytosine(967)-C(5))-methyltransferase RsmB [Clostridia bacterium]
MGNINPARQAAHTSLVSCLANDKFVNLEVSAILKRTNLQGADRGLYTALVYTTIERLLTIDYIISKLSSRPVDEIDEKTLCAVRLGICQLEFMDKIPPHAAVDESVELCPRKSRGFANALLRSFLRKKPDMPKKEGGELLYLSVKYSTPVELCELFVRDYGDEAEAVLAAFLEKKDTAIRVNSLRAESAEKAILMGAYKSELCRDVMLVKSFDGVLDGVERGDWFVQDEASALCAQMVGAKPGETVVDTCAAPGGKSFALALNMENKGRIYSFDLHDNKISLIKKGAQKLGIDIIEAEARDARNPREDIIEKADRVLCDAPCSGFGVIGKKPDIKYKDVKASEGLPRVQAQVIRGAAQYVKKGGVLVYSTCTILKRENEEIVKDFLRENPQFELVEMKTMLPHIDGTDGFFICKMIRKETV